jgi:hypothetical protein
MAMSTKLLILGATLACVLGLAIATGYAKPGAARRRLARLGATAFFAFLALFFWLSPFAERGGFLTAMAAFFSIGGAISVWKLVTEAGAGVSEKSATH